MRLIGGVHVAVVTEEEQGPTIGSTELWTAPVVAGGTAMAERTIAAAQVPCSMEF